VGTAAAFRRNSGNRVFLSLRGILGVSEGNSWKFLGTGGKFLGMGISQENHGRIIFLGMLPGLGNSSLKKLWPFTLL
jgi:hypothetical protein